SRRRHTRSYGDWSSDVCSSDLERETDGQYCCFYAVDDCKMSCDDGTYIGHQSLFLLGSCARGESYYDGHKSGGIDSYNRTSVNQIGRASCRERVEKTDGADACK